MLNGPIDHIVFDWNGTLIDDVELAVRSVNHVGSAFGLGDISRDAYRRTFCFPIRSFYARLGCEFGTISFEAAIARYLCLFDAGIRDCPLQPGARRIVAWAQRAGLTASILSASHEDTLRETLHHHRLTTEFDHVMGLGDTLAQGKLAVADALDARLGHPGQRALMVGDTLHDVEVAVAQGWQAVVVTHGHQDEAHFLGAGAPVVSDLDTLLRYLDDYQKSDHVCEAQS